MIRMQIIAPRSAKPLEREQLKNRSSLLSSQVLPMYLKEWKTSKPSLLLTVLVVIRESTQKPLCVKEKKGVRSSARPSANTT